MAIKLQLNWVLDQMKTSYASDLCTSLDHSEVTATITNSGPHLILAFPDHPDRTTGIQIPEGVTKTMRSKSTIRIELGVTWFEAAGTCVIEA